MARNTVGVPGAKNLKALRAALEHSVTIQAARLQEIVDETVSRGAMTRAEADKLVSQLVTSSKGHTAGLLQALDAVATEVRKGLGAGVATGVETVGKIAETVRAAPKLVAVPGLGSKTPEPAAKSTEPIADYSSLTVAQIKPKLAGLSKEDLRGVRVTEAGGKNRKSLLAEIDRLLKD